MRQDPNPDKDPSQKTFAGDNFVRQSGAVAGFSSLNAFSVTAYERGQDVHLQATPSQAEAAFQHFKTRKAELGQSSKADMLAKYGNAAAPLTEDVAALRGSEAYVEYDAAGQETGPECVRRPALHGVWWRVGLTWGPSQLRMLAQAGLDPDCARSPPTCTLPSQAGYCGATRWWP